MTDMITPARLRSERGWTDSLIRTFLGEPDKTRLNPHYRSGPPMKLYRLDRVNQIEASDEFRGALKVAQRRSRAASIAADRRYETTITEAIKIKITLVRLPLAIVRQKAIEHYNNSDRANRNGRYASENDSIDFINRIMVNFLRHQLTDYDHELDQLRRKVGKADAAAIIRDAVFEEIAEVYPELAEEAERQQRARDNAY